MLGRLPAGSTRVTAQRKVQLETSATALRSTVQDEESGAQASHVGGVHREIECPSRHLYSTAALTAWLQPSRLGTRPSGQANTHFSAPKAAYSGALLTMPPKAMRFPKSVTSHAISVSPSLPEGVPCAPAGNPFAAAALSRWSRGLGRSVDHGTFTVIFVDKQYTAALSLTNSH